MSEWFRNTDWTSEIEKEFFRKLSRARSQKAQYLRIQACYLAKRRPEISLSLLERYFALSDQFDLSQAYLDQAHAYIALGDVSRAVDSLVSALNREKEFPNSKSNAAFEYPLFVAVNGIRDHFAAAVRVAEESRREAIFPSSKFSCYAASALLCAQLNLVDEAKKNARIALEIAQENKSPFSRHPTVGLIGDEYDGVRLRLEQLLGEQFRTSR